MGRSAVRVLVLALCLIGLATAARAERRVALLVGNAAYREAVLRNPVNDVAAMKATLTAAGFDVVIARTDLDRAGMLKALRSFEDAVAGADIGVVFYSGHGIEFRGQNYLLPVDAHPDTDRDIADQAIDLDRVLDSLSGATKLKLVLLDACRSNPFVDGVRRVATKGTASKGLAPVEASTADTLIAYAAAPGHVALDGGGAQSPFTAALVRHLTTSGLDVELALRRVRDDVLLATNHEQVPFKTGSLGGEEILLGRPANGPAWSTPVEPNENTKKPAADLPADSSPSSGPTLVALYGAWGVYTGTNGTAPICYATSQSLPQDPVGGVKIQLHAFVSYEPGKAQARKVSISTNFIIGAGTNAFASVAGDNIGLRGEVLSARTFDASDEVKLLSDMSKGSSLLVYFSLQEDWVSLSEFSLQGFAEAMDRLSDRCT